MNGKIPAYLYEKGNTVKMILFTAFFALLFINIFLSAQGHGILLFPILSILLFPA
jgi:hypothetical protein